MNLREIGRERGRKAAAAARQNNLPEVMQRDFRMNGELFPTLGADFDFASAVLAYDRERLACEPDYARLPELRGLIERHLGEREGFIENSGFTPTHAAFHYSFHHYLWKRVNSQHVARYDLASAQLQCTNVFFPHGKDGVTVSDNRDDVPRPWYAHIRDWKVAPPKAGTPVHWGQGSVSSSILLDEEPRCLFPCNPQELMPEDCLNDIREIVKFMTRYADFWGPANQLWVDRKLRGVMVEKANVRVAYRWPASHGVICITACSYIDPELNAFKRSRLLEVARRKGERPEECMDLIFSDGCDRRQHRLLELTNKAAAQPGGASLWDAFNCVADTGVPFPARVCLAGEKCDPVREPNSNWTLTQYAAVLTGPDRRALYRSVQDVLHPKPIYSYTPKLVLGEGVGMKPAWQADVDAGRCELVEELVPA